MNKTLYIVTHGQKDDQPNPSHTDYGRNQIRDLKQYLPSDPGLVIIGLGTRHFEMSGLLGINFDQDNCLFNAIAGRSTSLKPGTRDQVFLANGVVIDIKQWQDFAQEVFWNLFIDLPDNSIVLGGRPFARSILESIQTNHKALSASVYKMTIENGKVIDIEHHSSEEAERGSDREV